MANETETCEDRDWVCCDLWPPSGGMTNAEYEQWYGAHVIYAQMVARKPTR